MHTVRDKTTKMFDFKYFRDIVSDYTKLSEFG